MSAPPPPRRRLGVALAAVAVLVVVAGCARDDGPPASPSSAAPAPAATATAGTPVTTGEGGVGHSASAAHPAPATPAQPAAGPGRCHTSELSLAFGPAQAGAGQRQGVVILKNESARECTILGFGGLQVLDAARRPLPVELERVGPSPTLVRFGPRSNEITKAISWTAVPSDSGCVQPVYVLVTPPDETDPLTGQWPYGAICGGRLAGFAYGAAVEGR
jgi:hypothetical protein